jgi:hypothetical protein
MSSSSAILSKQYWVGSTGFRDTSDLILFKKRQGIRYLYQEPVRPPLLQSLQNRTSFQFSELDCLEGCTVGGFPQTRLTDSTPI